MSPWLISTRILPATLVANRILAGSLRHLAGPPIIGALASLAAISLCAWTLSRHRSRRASGRGPAS